MAEPRTSAPFPHGAEQTDQDESEERTPEEIRADIERTRADLGDTAAALAEKADVKAQAKGKVEEVKDRASQKKDDFVGKAKSASPDTAAGLAGQATSVAQDRPLPLAVAGALAAGFILGRLTKR